MNEEMMRARDNVSENGDGPDLRSQYDILIEELTRKANKDISSEKHYTPKQIIKMVSRDNRT